ncbi:MAG: ParA family protein, partial [Phycisphaerales bacterium]
MKTIAVVNQKGGCGKTTVSINLGSALAEAGQKVLLVDMDPQSHCAVGLAVPEEQIEQSIYDVLISRSRNEPMKMTEILWQISERLELAPASLDLSAFEQQMNGISDRERCLKEALHEIRNDYDYTIIDCPPAVGLLTFNALRAATDVIVPVETGYFALHGLSKQLETLSILCKRCSQQVNVRVLASMYDIRTKMAREILAELRSHFGDRMFGTIVSFNTKIKEAASFGQPISEYDPASKGRKDFASLADEIIGAQADMQRHEFVNSLADQLESISATADELLEEAKPSIVSIDSPRTQQAETPTPNLNEDEFTPAEKAAFREFKAGAEVQELQDQTVEQLQTITEEKPLVRESDIEAKLADYYGVTQTTDAAVFVTL